ncbi:Threonine/homoserine/homoserine lactone efflux protein [Streptomyces sp. BpilaLS-43]|uniref:LysE family translocator n=1 Tax=Streptomyces sp. BpilaLS-43 TaxID=1839778 RepID=UPI00081B71B7|nr:LysE family translocator [Streptomyces sp. BpilaLS-43]SCD53652.1 Threonine/homoserine/homoserine lactone efflux protein [Streptomyces sp. BpilaLS-43]
MSVDLVGFLGVVLVAYLVPGPDFLLVVRSAAEHPSNGRAAALGTQSGLCVHMLAAALGLSFVAARSPAVYDAVAYCGAAYLVYLGVRAVLTARRRTAERADGATAHEEAGSGGNRERGPRTGFAQGFLTNVLNPKAALFFLGVLPQFVDGGGSMTRGIFFLGTLDVLIGVAYWLAVVGVAARLRALLARPAVRRRWELTTGWLFIAIGVAVATAA